MTSFPSLICFCFYPKQLSLFMSLLTLQIYFALCLLIFCAYFIPCKVHKVTDRTMLPIFLSLYIVYAFEVVLNCPFDFCFVHAAVKQLVSRRPANFRVNTSQNLVINQIRLLKCCS